LLIKAIPQHGKNDNKNTGWFINCMDAWALSAEQSAIIESIQSEKNYRHEIVIITDSLNTIMAAENRTPTKNPKAQTIRMMLDHEGPRMTLLWVPCDVGIPGNERSARHENLNH
jgi:hypothetical protein